MPRYASWLKNGMELRGHQVKTWTAPPKLINASNNTLIKKWLAYVDQYIIFPQTLKKRLKDKASENVLFVFTDHALGPWVPYVKKYPHIIHCHDFLAQRSALGEIPENATGFTGRLYQKFIRTGYRKGKNFICISQKTESDLLHFLEPNFPEFCEVIYNGLNQDFFPLDKVICRRYLSDVFQKDFTNGYILHVGGNQWYKNRLGVLKLYVAWRNSRPNIVYPLIMIGKEPTRAMKIFSEKSGYDSDIHFFSQVDDESLKKAYVGAVIFLFPSLAEGFGWPIAEAMASGTIVITTDEKPMTEVGGTAAFYIPRETVDNDGEFINQGVKMIQALLNKSAEDLKLFSEKGLEQAKKFDSDLALDKIEAAYKSIIV
ncbi:MULTISPECIES: glycosyltransferase [unclassified Leeuwenhoekiella]|uniref:glycosyltransferase n=1 Tax=unclassified Leeuwenhoekiella TaxID=2615029 RepID=UPI0025BCAB92|nr:MULTISPECIES: glycosyltransferase [unclassified Leeuwenhoekiella]|tara:strand:- start:12276 stop:13391 length:1116 start_codon:yes stop_codon:yes gene_type:complete